MIAADLEWVAALEAELHPHPWTIGNFQDSLNAGHACWVVSSEKRPLGYAVLMVVLDEAHLLNISVDRAQQRRGIGMAVLGFLCDWSRRQGAEHCFLEVRESNLVAMRLYHRAGFEAIGRRKGYYPAAGLREDAIVMRCAL